MGLTFYFNRIGSHRFTTVVSYHSVGAHHELEMRYKSNDLIKNCKGFAVNSFSSCNQQTKDSPKAF